MDVALLNRRILVQKNEVTVDAIGNHLNKWVDFLFLLCHHQRGISKREYLCRDGCG